MWGFRLGPTDVTHPLLTFVNCPFNLLRWFKDGAHRSKTYFIILSQLKNNSRATVPVSPAPFGLLTFDHGIVGLVVIIKILTNFTTSFVSEKRVSLENPGSLGFFAADSGSSLAFYSPVLPE